MLIMQYSNFKWKNYFIIQVKNCMRHEFNDIEMTTKILYYCVIKTYNGRPYHKCR